jgi:uracil phosphoribosyltransferase
MNDVTIIDHPLVQHNLVKLRDKRTGPEEFRRALAVVATLMVYESTRSLATRSVSIQTPMARARGSRLKHEVVLVPVLRAGLGMLFSILQLIPQARVGFIGMKRQEKSLRANSYLESLPKDLSDREILLIDPMLATGGSSVSALNLLRERGGKRVRLVNLVAAPEGVRLVRSRFPKVPIFAAALDKRLNRNGFIMPGLGDAGDRLFGV